MHGVLVRASPVVLCAGLQACKNGMSARVGTAQPQQQGVDLLAELAAYLAALEAPPRSLSDPLKDSQVRV